MTIRFLPLLLCFIHPGLSPVVAEESRIYFGNVEIPNFGDVKDPSFEPSAESGIAFTAGGHIGAGPDAPVVRNPGGDIVGITMRQSVIGFISAISSGYPGSSFSQASLGKFHCQRSKPANQQPE